MIERLVHQDNSYIRENDYLNSYIEQAAFYLHKQRGISYPSAKEFVKSNLTNTNFSITNPLVKHTVKDENGDTSCVETKLSDYIYKAISSNDFIAPTFTTYLNPKVKVSLLADFITYNKEERSKAKKEGFKAYVEYNYLTTQAKEASDQEKAKLLEKSQPYLLTHHIKDSEQSNAKIANNSISGAHVTPSNPLYCRSTHSTLTSITRVTSNTTNVLAEKLIYGNRYYPDYESIINNITNICYLANKDKQRLESVMSKYNLYYPSVDEVMQVITYSSSLYFNTASLLAKVRSYLEKLSSFDLAAFTYINDLYHLKKFNSDLVRSLFDRVLKTAEYDVELEVIDNFEDGMLSMAMLLNFDAMKGMGKDFKKLYTEKKELVNKVGATLLEFDKGISEYEDLLDTLILTEVSPNSVSFSPDMIRRCVIVSDTDSTIYTAAVWADWYSGSLKVTNKANNAQYFMGYLLSQATKHYLAKMSANMGADDHRLRAVGSKGEYTFPVMALPGVSKTYFANISTQEANIYASRKIEIKGVHLKPSNSTKGVVKDAEKMMTDILDTVTSNGKVSLVSQIKHVIDLETSIEKELLSGTSEFFKFGKIKGKSAYKNDNSPYKRHLLWMEVFSEKYGNPGEPPYLCIQLSLELNNKTEINAWLEKITDPVIKEKLRTYLTRENKSSLSTVYVPVDIVRGSSLPVELSLALDTTKVISKLMKSHYLILSSLGYELNNTNYLLKDQIDISQLYGEKS